MKTSAPNDGRDGFETVDCSCREIFRYGTVLEAARARTARGWPRISNPWAGHAHARAATIVFGRDQGPRENCQQANPSSAPGVGELAKRHPDASIYVVDQDPWVCTGIPVLLTSAGLKVRKFSNVRAFLEYRPADSAACLVLNLESADSSRDALSNWIRGPRACPVIYVSDHLDIPSAVRVIKEGAVDFLTKPIDTGVLLSAISLALACDAAARARDAEMAALQRRFSTLTPRERQVLSLVIGGMRNKQAAAALGISDVTLQIHRSQVMRKMAAHSFAELIRMSLAIGFAAEPPQTRWSWVWREPCSTWAAIFHSP